MAIEERMTEEGRMGWRIEGGRGGGRIVKG